MGVFVQFPGSIATIAIVLFSSYISAGLQQLRKNTLCISRQMHWSSSFNGTFRHCCCFAGIHPKFFAFCIVLTYPVFTIFHKRKFLCCLFIRFMHKTRSALLLRFSACGIHIRVFGIFPIACKFFAMIWINIVSFYFSGVK